MWKGIKKKVLIGLSMALGMLLSVYLGMGIFFIKHFYYHTTINGKEVGGKTISEIEAMLQNEAKSYRVVLKERGDRLEAVLGDEVGYTYRLGDQMAKLKEKQKAFGWLTKVWKQKYLKVNLEPTYDEVLFKARFNKLECLLPENNIAPKDALLVFKGDTYVLQEGDKGSQVIEEALYRVLQQAFLGQEAVINLEDKNCYKEAKYTVEAKELIAKKEALNEYVETQITYNFGNKTEILDGEEIHKWIEIGKNNAVILDEAAVKDYVKRLAMNYDTLKSSREFKTSLGSTVTVVGGDYGWRIDQEKETKALIALLKEGKQKISREPEYDREAWNRYPSDIGDTYVEINLTRQYLWLYKDGKRITEGNIVTGTGTNSHATPEGTYGIDFKKADVILRGPGYAAPVSFWMPFNGGIGIHDATWRGSFGGSIYVYNGSHGCINTPYELAKTIFSEVEAGMPVICYKDAT